MNQEEVSVPRHHLFSVQAHQESDAKCVWALDVPGNPREAPTIIVGLLIKATSVVIHSKVEARGAGMVVILRC